jgi:RimJ/RimL family protein N-acetyltransferase
LGAIALGLAPEHRCASLGNWLGVPSWNHGYMSEAARVVTEFALNTLPLHRVQALCFPRNVGSIRVLERAGLTFEGVLRGYVLKQGVPEDVAMYARLASG